MYYCFFSNMTCINLISLKLCRIIELEVLLNPTITTTTTTTTTYAG